MKANGRPIQLVPMNALKTFAKSAICLKTVGLQNEAPDYVSVSSMEILSLRKKNDGLNNHI